jgi:hypothetical protein
MAPPAGIQGALGAGQRGVDRLIQDGKLAVGQERQPGHRQVLVGLGDGEADRPLGQARVRVMPPTIARPHRGGDPVAPLMKIVLMAGKRGLR